MGDVFLTETEGRQVEELLRYGFEVPSAPKWWVINVAIARSLAMEGEPGDEFGRPQANQGKGAEIHLEQIVGRKTSSDDNLEGALRLLLGAKHSIDLTDDEACFIDLLQRHTRRGLQELRATWRRGNDFYNFLYQDFFYSQIDSSPTQTISNKPLLQNAMQQIGIQFDLIGEPIIGPRITRYIMQLRAVDGQEKLQASLGRLKFVLGGLPSNPMITEQDGEKTLALDIPRTPREWQPIPAKTVEATVYDASGDLPICLGVTPIGEPFVFDLAEEPHIFIAGATGMGKSTCVHAIILSLLTSKRNVELLLIDPKKVEFAPYSRLKNLYRGQVCTAPHTAFEMLAELVEEMERRENIFVGLGVVKISEAVAKGHNLPRILVIIEELADLIMQYPEIEEPLIQLAAKGRSSGIHLILATQRPDAATFKGLLRSNIPCRAALYVQSASHSRIILDESGAEDLMSKGDLLLKRAGHKVQRLHGAFVQSTDVLALNRS